KRIFRKKNLKDESFFNCSEYDIFAFVERINK
ncbi:LOW QUALITY PROTEIN: hypothetical protein TorRG33x02_106430, partial [Trema orientale]